MKKVYFYSAGCLNFCGKVRKDYKEGDTLKLKSMICKLKVIEDVYGKNNFHYGKDIHVIQA